MFPEVVVYPADDPERDGVIGCRLVDEDQSEGQDRDISANVSIYLDLVLDDLTSKVAFHRELIAGSGDPDGPCPSGASDPKITGGASTETSLLCETGEESLFEYGGKFTNGDLYFRVMRSTSFGSITADEAQSWIDFVVSKLREIDGEAADISSPDSPQSAPTENSWTREQMYPATVGTCSLPNVDDLLIELLGMPVHTGGCAYSSGTESNVTIEKIVFPDDLPGDALRRVNAQCDYVNDRTDAWSVGEKSCGTVIYDAEFDDGYLGLAAIGQTYYRIIVNKVDMLPNPERDSYGPLAETILSRIASEQ